MIQLIIYHPLYQINNDVDTLLHEIFVTLKFRNFAKFLCFESI